MPWLEVLVGQRVYLEARFTKAASPAAPDVRQPVDPDTARLIGQAPNDGARTEWVWPAVAGAGELVRDDVGLFHVEHTVDVAGEWEFRTESTGAVEAPAELVVRVRESRLSP